MVKNILQEIKSELETWVGKKVYLRANRGRKKILQKEGVLEQTYPHLFVVILDDETCPRRISFTYADVLTESVEILTSDRKAKIGCINI